MLISRAKLLFNPSLRTPLLNVGLNKYYDIEQTRGWREWPTWPNNWVPFKWNKPVMRPGYFESGDLTRKVPFIKGKELRPIVQDLEILKDAPPDVRKMFSWRWARRREKTLAVKEKAEASLPFRKRPFDENEYERKIIRLTYSIRLMQGIIRKEQRNSAGAKSYCARYIAKRFKYINELYKKDRETCLALLEQLKISFEPPLPYHWPYIFKERKRGIRETCEKYCKDIRDAKLQAFHDNLKEQQKAFAVEKEEALKYIEDTMAKFNITEDMLKDPEPRCYLKNTHELLK